MSPVRAADDQPGAPCPRCRTAQPAVAHFCHRCGHDHQGRRARHFVARPAEAVRTPNAVATLLPLASGGRVRGYELAFVAALVIPMVAAAAGWVPFAFVAAAVAVPALFAIYLYDVNEWDDQPVPVVLATLVAGAVLGAAGGFVVERLLLAPSGGLALDPDSGDARRLLVLGIVAPLLGLVLGLIGPLWLASRPRFDDLLDGLTFGAVSGAAYAAGETLVGHRGILGWERGGEVVLWVSIVANAGAVKPVVYGSALAIAAASFSGIGAGCDGLSPRFARGAGIAALGLVAYGAGVTALGLVGGPAGAAFGLLWAIAVAAVLLVTLRTQLQRGILEAALEAAGGKPSRHEVARDARCGECEMPLVPLALFCNSCGATVRATSKDRQRANVAGSVA
jgi:hypothetical protein